MQSSTCGGMSWAAGIMILLRLANSFGIVVPSRILYDLQDFMALRLRAQWAHMTQRSLAKAL